MRGDNMLLTCVTFLISLFHVVETAQLQMPFVERPSEDEYMTRAAKLMKSFPMIDGHNVGLPCKYSKLIPGLSDVVTVSEERLHLWKLFL